MQTFGTGRKKKSAIPLLSVQKDNIILVRQKTQKGYEECLENGVVNLSYPSVEKRGKGTGAWGNSALRLRHQMEYTA